MTAQAQVHVMMKKFFAVVLSRACIGAVYLSLTATLWATTVSAQYSPTATMDLGMGYGQIALSQSIFSGTRRSGGSKNHSGKSKKSLPKKPQAKTNPLVFRWDDSLSRQYRQDLITRASHLQLGDRAAITKRLSRLNPTKTFRQLAYQYGLNPSSIPDLAATYCAASWEMLNGRKASRKKVFQVRNDIRRQMESSSFVMNTLRDADQKAKQFWLEEQAYEIILNRTSYAELKQTGNTRKIKEFRAQAVSNAKKRGVTIDKLNL